MRSTAKAEDPVMPKISVEANLQELLWGLVTGKMVTEWFVPSR